MSVESSRTSTRLLMSVESSTDPAGESSSWQARGPFAGMETLSGEAALAARASVVRDTQCATVFDGASQAASEDVLIAPRVGAEARWGDDFHRGISCEWVVRGSR